MMINEDGSNHFFISFGVFEPQFHSQLSIMEPRLWIPTYIHYLKDFIGICSKKLYIISEIIFRVFLVLSVPVLVLKNGLSKSIRLNL